MTHSNRRTFSKYEWIVFNAWYEIRIEWSPVQFRIYRWNQQIHAVRQTIEIGSSSVEAPAIAFYANLQQKNKSKLNATEQYDLSICLVNDWNVVVPHKEQMSSIQPKKKCRFIYSHCIEAIVIVFADAFETNAGWYTSMAPLQNSSWINLTRRIAFWIKWAAIILIICFVWICECTSDFVYIIRHFMVKSRRVFLANSELQVNLTVIYFLIDFVHI